MQHINVKIFAQTPLKANLADAIPVFHRWIQDRVCPETMIDVADYSHVPSGPGVVLIGHEANYALDNAHDRPGLLYNRKVMLGGTVHSRLRQAYDAVLAASLRLVREPEFQERLAFRDDEVEIVLNDRMLYPNTEMTWRAVEGDLRVFFDELFGAGGYKFTRASDPRERFRVSAQRLG
jgi:hypothetical protein